MGLLGTGMKKQVTIRIDKSVLAYFKAMARERGIPYQSPMN